MSTGPGSLMAASFNEAPTGVLRLQTGTSSSALFCQQVENQLEFCWYKANLAKLRSSVCLHRTVQPQAQKIFTSASFLAPSGCVNAADRGWDALVLLMSVLNSMERISVSF